MVGGLKAHLALHGGEPGVCCSCRSHSTARRQGLIHRKPRAGLLQPSSLASRWDLGVHTPRPILCRATIKAIGTGLVEEVAAAQTCGLLGMFQDMGCAQHTVLLRPALSEHPDPHSNHIMTQGTASKAWMATRADLVLLSIGHIDIEEGLQHLACCPEGTSAPCNQTTCCRI